MEVWCAWPTPAGLITALERVKKPLRIHIEFVGTAEFSGFVVGKAWAVAAGWRPRGSSTSRNGRTVTLRSEWRFGGTGNTGFLHFALCAPVEMTGLYCGIWIQPSRSL